MVTLITRLIMEGELVLILLCFSSLKASQTHATFVWKPVCSWWNYPSTHLWTWCWRNCVTPSTTARILSAAEKTWQPNVSKHTCLPLPSTYTYYFWPLPPCKPILLDLLLRQTTVLYALLLHFTLGGCWCCMFIPAFWNHSLHKILHFMIMFDAYLLEELGKLSWSSTDNKCLFSLHWIWEWNNCDILVFVCLVPFPNFNRGCDEVPLMFCEFTNVMRWLQISTLQPQVWFMIAEFSFSIRCRWS